MNYNCTPLPKYILYLYSVPSKSDDVRVSISVTLTVVSYILGAVYCTELPTKIIEQNHKTNRKSVPCIGIRRDTGSATRSVRKSRNDIIIIISLSPCAV